VALAHLSEVVLIGSAGVTTAAMLALLDAGCGLTLVSAQGKLRGRLRPVEAGNLDLRRVEFAATADAEFALEISRRIVAGKIRNSRTLARRMLRTPPKGSASADPEPGVLDEAGPRMENSPLRVGPLFDHLKTTLAMVDRVATLAELRGVEGQAARLYFKVLRLCLNGKLIFEKRTRRPPRDPVNALLSLAYTLLTNAVFAAVEVAGLDPYAGFLHQDRYGRPALVLDLVEEFRPVIADSVVLTTVNKGMLDAQDFETDAAGGIWLKKKSLRTFLVQFSHRLQTQTLHPAAGRALTYQKILEVQARAIRKCIETRSPAYVPFEAK
jgi:CRISPR-associated protein Cas1